jgi:ribosomal protein S7
VKFLFIISSKKRIFNAIKLSINFIRLEFKNNFLINYKNEIIKILKKNSDFLIKKDEIHSSALKNKAYAHFRWF